MIQSTHEIVATALAILRLAVLVALLVRLCADELATSCDVMWTIALPTLLLAFAIML